MSNQHSNVQNDCRECLHSILVTSENGYKAICTLNTKESNSCLFNNKCNFEGNPLYLMIKGKD